MLRLLVALLAGLIAGTAYAQSQDFEPVLLPVTVIDAPGAYGSVWTTRAGIYVDADGDYLVIPLWGEGCVPPSCLEPVGPTRRNYLALGFLPTRAGEPDGAFIYLTRAVADHVYFSLRLSSPTGSNGPVQIPVARERDFRSGRVQIVSIPPVTPNLRLTARVYGIDPARGGSVRVRLIGEIGHQVLAEDRVRLVTSSAKYPGPYTLSAKPASATLSYAVPTPPQYQTIRLEVQADDPDLRLWAFVSLTDNVNQSVSVYAP
jgi:hypothetical protein